MGNSQSPSGQKLCFNGYHLSPSPQNSIFVASLNASLLVLTDSDVRWYNASDRVPALHWNLPWDSNTMAWRVLEKQGSWPLFLLQVHVMEKFCCIWLWILLSGDLDGLFSHSVRNRGKSAWCTGDLEIISAFRRYLVVPHTSTSFQQVTAATCSFWLHFSMVFDDVFLCCICAWNLGSF